MGGAGPYVSDRPGLPPRDPLSPVSVSPSVRAEVVILTSEGGDKQEAKVFDAGPGTIHLIRITQVLSAYDSKLLQLSGASRCPSIK